MDEDSIQDMSLDEFKTRVHEYLPTALVEKNSSGEIVIYTGFSLADNPRLVPIR